MEHLKTKLQSLLDGGLCVAFSGGVDSSVLLKLACELAPPQTIHAVTFETKLHPCADLAVAQRVAQEVGAIHHVISVNELDNVDILHNPVDRCYRCKKHLFSTLIDYAKTHNLAHIIDGTNADDLTAYRPGIGALKELGIISPLAELGITKAKVRQLASDLNLSVSNRPSAPCLATRLPYNTPIDLDLLARIDRGETYLKSLGFAVNRIRVHGAIARIEIPTDQVPACIAQQQAIVTTIHDLGLPYVTLDLEGFRSGSLDIYVRGDLWT